MKYNRGLMPVSIAPFQRILIGVVTLCQLAVLTTPAHAGWNDVRLDSHSQWLDAHDEPPQNVITLSSPIFRLAIDQQRGGELTQLQLYDGATWRPVIGEDGNPFPGLTIRLKGMQEPLVPHQTELHRKNISDQKADLVYIVPLNTPHGDPSGLTLSYHYEVFPEGALFLRFGLTGWPVAPIVETSVALELDQSAVDAAHFRDEQLVTKSPALASARTAFGWEPRRSYTNELEAQIENRKGLTGDITYQASPGRYTWQLAPDDTSDDEQADGVSDKDPHDVRKAPVLYYNRIALGMSNSPYPTSRSNCIGDRVYHWVNFLDLSPENWHPTDTELADMVDKGATTLILHHEYMDQRGSNGSPHADYTVLREDDQLNRCLETAEKLGLCIGIYLRGIEPYALNDDYIQSLVDRGVDGFYIDWHGSHAIAFHESRELPATALGDRHYSQDGSAAPAREYFRYIKRLRRMVGPDGFIIGHLGSFNSGVLPNVGIDGFVAGETTSEWALFDSPQDAVYRGMMAGAVVMPWPEEAAAFSEPRSLAKMAAWGFYPHLLMGIDKPKTGLFPRDPGSDQYQTIKPYWQLLKHMGPMRNVRVLNLPADAAIVATTDNDNASVVVYQKPRGDLLVLVTNLSDQPSDTTLRLDSGILPEDGSKWLLIGQDTETLTPLALGKDQRSTTVPLYPNEITGVLIRPASDRSDTPRPTLGFKELP